MGRIIARGAVASLPADRFRSLRAECTVPPRKRTAELANRVPSPLGSASWPTNREPRCALRSDDTDARREARRCVGRSHRSAQRSGPCHILMESMERPHEQSANLRHTRRDRGTGRRHSCRTARGSPKRLTQAEGAVVLARRTVLRSSSPRLCLAGIPPVKVASMHRRGWAAVLSRGSRMSVPTTSMHTSTSSPP
jgi:hypothetical protein